MAWCPECKQEYEENATMCADCEVELVKSLDDIPKDRILLVLNTMEEVNKVLEFLEYSDIKSGKVQEKTADSGETVFQITVLNEDWSAASRFIQGYAMVEKEEPDREEFYFDKYVTIDIEAETELAEIKSSYLSFIGLGGVVFIIGLLNVFGLLSFLSGNLPIVFSLIGGVFIIIGFYTKVTMDKKITHVESIKNEFDELYQWYTSNFPIDSFYARHEVDLANLDEGAKYFALMDILVKECTTNDITDNEELINTVAERVFNQL